MDIQKAGLRKNLEDFRQGTLALFETVEADLFLPVHNSLIDYPVKRYDRAFELTSDVINENFTAIILDGRGITMATNARD